MRCIYLGVALAASNFLTRLQRILIVPRMVQFSHIDVHGLPVALAAQLLVRVTTHTVSIGHALRVEDIADLVRLMAIHARRQDVGFLFPQLSTNDFSMHGFDQRMAFRAGGGNIPPGD